ncbi:uncharacterized protein AB9W97_017172 [Spinachia spinachia]
MKASHVLAVTLLTSTALVGVTKMRQLHQDKDKRNRVFQDIKLRVVYDVLQDHQATLTETRILLEKTTKEQDALEEEVKVLQIQANEAKGGVDVCAADKKSALEKLVLLEAEFESLKAEHNNKMTALGTELLKKQLAAQSAVCGFLKPGSQPPSQLCRKEPKAEAPKPEEPKAEAPKPEEPKPKAEAPKPEEPKAEAPKPEEPKAEAPKPEEPKAEAPKPEEPKAEAPKPEEPKAEAPKPEEPKAEAPSR